MNWSDIKESRYGIKGMCWLCKMYVNSECKIKNWRIRIVWYVYEYMESSVESVVKKVSLSKKTAFKTEQENIVKKLDVILGFVDENRSICIDTLRDNIDMQKKIIELEKECKMYFASGNWAYFVSKGTKEYISLMKSIYKSTGHKIERKPMSIKGDKGYYKTTYKYIITKMWMFI